MLKLEFKAIYQSEVSFIWYHLRRLGVPDRDLKDKVHDVFVVLHRRWADLDPARPVRPWLMGVAYKVAAEYHRKASNSREIIGKDVQPRDHGPGPERSLVQREARDLVHGALDRLKPTHRAVFVLHDMEGMSAPQIAEATDTPVNTVYSRLRVARRQFVRAVEGLQKTPPRATRGSGPRAARRGMREESDEQSN